MAALWCLTPLSTIFQLYRGGSNSDTRRIHLVRDDYCMLKTGSYGCRLIGSLVFNVKFSKISAISWRMVVDNKHVNDNYLCLNQKPSAIDKPSQ